MSKITQVETQGLKKVALTFDDGPNPPYTNQILDILKTHEIPATFFVCGANIEHSDEHRHALERAAREGHQIGNHSFDHDLLPSYLGLNIPAILETQGLIEFFTGPKQPIFRMPNFPTPPWMMFNLKQLGFKVPPVGTMGFDWKENLSPEDIAQNVIKGMRGQSDIVTKSEPERRVHVWLRKRFPAVFSRSVILLHDGAGIEPNKDRSRTVAALEILIDRLSEDGYEFVELSKLTNNEDYTS